MLLKDAINIPTEVHAGDLVTKVFDATNDPQGFLSTYVVTDQLSEAFVKAVGIVGDAITSRSSRAAYLSGSFGAGKSSFMGVLQLLLDGQPDALAVPELAPAVAALNTWRSEQKFLTIPFHLIGATSIESAIFGGYVDYVLKHHPDAPMPDVFAHEPMLEMADRQRRRFGDEAFFSAFPDSAADDGWGNVTGQWTAARYDAARHLPVSDPELRSLVEALARGPLEGIEDVAQANSSGYVGIKDGVAAISRHAHDLGYAGVILFLDELILWLMSRIADIQFVGPEASKLSALVEGDAADRPVPVISLVARQRDLRRLIGDDTPGAKQLGFIDVLNHQEGRFEDITLNDSNLPVIANRRLLRPTSPDGAAALEQAFARLDLTEEQRDDLRGVNGTDDDFRLTYPFSPAFLTVVVDVASALQRTRTGLRVLLELLVEHRETLEVGQLVPVGDLFDVLSRSDAPLTDAMAQSMKSAERIYRNVLVPILRSEHQLGPNDPVTPAFVNDDRLVKTLLLAALVPNSEPFRNMTARKLVTLNHGLISSPVPGAEIGVAISKLKSWNARTGELQLGGDDQNPTVRIVLSEVDTATILNAVAEVDTLGARRQLLRQLIADELGVTSGNQSTSTSVLWNGVQRPVDLVFGNIRDTSELGDSAFVADGDRWKMVIDFPFDDDGFTPLNDLERVAGLKSQDRQWRTVCWLPSFFTAETRSLLGDMVKLQHLVPVAGRSSDRYLEATRNLTPETREAARPQLEQRLQAVQQSIREAVHQAYGLTGANAAVVDASHGLADHYPTLVAGLDVQPPIAATLRDAFDAVVKQALSHSYPGAPIIELEVRRGELQTVLDVCMQAVELPELRLPQVPASDRSTVRKIANALEIGNMAEQAFVLHGKAGPWDLHFTRKQAEREQAGAEGHPTVGELRTWIDEPYARGLSPEMQNLVILSWAAATDRTFTDHGGPAATAVERLPDHFEVVAQVLPDADVWTEARERAEHILGIAGLPATPSAVGLARLSAALLGAVQSYGTAADTAVRELETVETHVAGDWPSQRRSTATTATNLLRSIGQATTDLGRVEVFTAGNVEPSAQALGAAVKAAGATVATADQLSIIETAFSAVGGDALQTDLVALLQSDELATPFAPTFRSLYDRAIGLIRQATPEVPAPKPPVDGDGGERPAEPVPADPPPEEPSGAAAAEHRGLTRAEAVKALKEIRDQLKAGDDDSSTFDITVVRRPGSESA